MTTEKEITANLNFGNRSASPVNFACLVGFLNYRGLGGEYIVLADEARLVTSVAGRRFYKIESLVFVPLVEGGPDDKVVKKLDAFQSLIVSFGYFSIGGNATMPVINRSRFEDDYPETGGLYGPGERREEYSVNREMNRDLVIAGCHEWISDVILVS